MKNKKQAKPGCGTVFLSLLVVLLIGNDLSQVFSLLIVVAVLGGVGYALYRFCGRHPLIAWFFALFGLINSP